MKINNKIKNQIVRFLRDNNNFLISAHTSPEGDSLGAQLAFMWVLKSLGKRCEVVNSDRYPREYSFLPGVNQIKTKPVIKKFDAAIILDCSDISRIGSVENFIDKNISILNIDHHISNTFFGHINFVDPKASSACEILYQLFKELNLKIDKSIAVCLYSGIVIDTGSFRYPNTSRETHLVVSDLLNWDIDTQGIFRNLYQNLDLSDFKLINEALSNIKKDSTGRLAWIKITQDLIKKYRPKIDLTDNILNFLRAIRDIEVCALFREKIGDEKNIRINLRSRGSVDVNKIAKHFGGGGHKTASGATLRNMSLNKAESTVINFIKKRL
jgi:phosphoesterase RecJ-like protein